MRRGLLCIVFVLVALAAVAQEFSSDKVLDVDREFARDLQANRDSLAKYRDDNFEVIDNFLLRDYFTGKRPDQFARLALYPKEAKIVSPRLAYTSGTYEFTYVYARCNCSAAQLGSYLTVWKHEKHLWRIIAIIPSMERDVGCGCSNSHSFGNSRR